MDLYRDIWATPARRSGEELCNAVTERIDPARTAGRRFWRLAAAASRGVIDPFFFPKPRDIVMQIVTWMVDHQFLPTCHASR